MLEKVKAMLGQGVTAEVRLPKDTYEPGDIIAGDIVIKGARAEQTVIDRVAVVFDEQSRLLSLERGEEARLMPIKHHSFIVAAREELFVPFSYSIPADLEIGKEQATYGLIARLKLDGAWQDYGKQQIKLVLPKQVDADEHLPYEDPEKIYLDDLEARKPL